MRGGQGGVSLGDVLNLKAIPDEGSEFVEWRINDQPYQGIFRMSGDTVLTAVFEPVVTPPVAAFSANPVSGIAPLTVIFTNTSTGDVTSYDWDFGDGETSNEEHPTYVYENAGIYTVSLTVSGPGGSDTLTQPDYIDVLQTNQAPVITITSPEEEAVVASGALQVTGTVSDDDTVVSVLVNDIPATVVGETFTATISFENGNHVITVAAEDDAGAVGLASCMVRVDGEGPMIGILSPKRGQSVYTVTPEINISYSDFYGVVDTVSLSVVLVDENSVSTDVTEELTITDTQAQGTLSTPLADDTKYTLNVSIADTLGNITQTAVLFYIPLEPASIVPPEVPEGAGWVSGTVYDSSTCNTHLTTCQGLAGAHVTLAYAGESGEPIPGTIVTGPDGFFAFPLPETNAYWLRVEKPGYTYAQREAEVVREHSTATNEIYLTPLDSNMTPCDETGCSHVSSDGMLQVEIPAGAIPAGQTVDVTATNFRKVEFLPSGALPPGTWETYAFNLGGDSEFTFAKPITVKLQNERGFDPGTKIPLGYWNQETQAWEHEGVGIVDATGNWVVMQVSHFSNYDCNDPLARPDDTDPETKEETSGSGSGSGPCSTGQGECFIDFQSGTFKEDYALPPVNVLGQEIAPQLLYSSRRASPSEVLDVSFSLNPGPGVVGLGNYVGFELFVEGRKTTKFSFAADLQLGDNRYRYFWDGRDVHGNLVPPGVYEYRIRLRIPYRRRYYYAINYVFGGPPDYVRGATNIYADAIDEIWVRGTVELNSQLDSPFGAGWVLAGQQRLYEDEAGRILISDGARNDEFYFFGKDLLSQRTLPGGTESLLAWIGKTDNDDGAVRMFPESLARDWPPILDSINVGSQPADIVLSPDGARAYVDNSSENSISVLDLTTTPVSVETTISNVGGTPQGLAISPDGSFLYVTNRDTNSVSAINLSTGMVTTTPVGNSPQGIAVSPDGMLACVANTGSRDLVVLSLADPQNPTPIASPSVGYEPWDVVISPDGAYAYTTTSLPGKISVTDSNITIVALQPPWQVTDTIPIGLFPKGITLSPDGSVAYVANHDDHSVSVVDLIERQELTTIDVWGEASGGEESPEDIALSPDGRVVYVANGSHNNVSIVDLAASQEVLAIDVRGEAYQIALSADGTRAYVVNRTGDTVEVLDLEAAQNAVQNMVTVDVGTSPSAMSLSPDGARAYVLDSEDNTLVVTDLQTRQELTTIAVGDNPQDVALSPDGLFAYVTNWNDNSVSVVDLSAQETVSTISVRIFPHGIAVSSNGMIACVANTGDNSLSVLDLQTW